MSVLNYVPRVPSCSSCLRCACALRVNMPYVPLHLTCLLFFLRALRTFLFLRALRAFIFLRALHTFSFLGALLALNFYELYTLSYFYVSYVPALLYVPSFFSCLACLHLIYVYANETHTN